MPRSLDLIPQGQPITDDDGAASLFFRLRWEALKNGFPQSPTIDSLTGAGLTAALPATAIYTTSTDGMFRLSCYLRKTVADGMSSSLTVTFGWVESGIAQSLTLAALTADTVAAIQTASATVRADAFTDLTIAIAYASNTPGVMTYRYDALAELMVL